MIRKHIKEKTCKGINYSSMVGTIDIMLPLMKAKKAQLSDSFGGHCRKFRLVDKSIVMISSRTADNYYVRI